MRSIRTRGQVRQGPLGALIFLLVTSAAMAAEAGEMVAGGVADNPLCAEPDPDLAGDWATAISFDNDKIGFTDSDSSYTTGLRVARSQAGLSRPQEAKERGLAEPAYENESKVLHTLRRAVKGLERAIWTPLGLLNDNTELNGYRQSVGGGFSIFTPETTDQDVVPNGERPYGASHYLFYGLEQEYCSPSTNVGKFWLSNKFVSSIEYQVGWIGSQPSETIIAGFHDYVWPAGGHTDGWDSRHINYEPMLNIFYNRVWSGFPVPGIAKSLGWFDDEDIARLSRPIESTKLGLGLQFRPHAGFALGNAYTYGSAGMTIRAGFHLPENIGPPTIRPASPGSDYFQRRPGKDACFATFLTRCENGLYPISAYVFTGAEARGVLYNAFLDGNLLSESPSVDKKPFVNDTYVGATVESGFLRLSYTRVQRSPEFDGQGDTTFGALTLGFNIKLPPTGG